MKLRQFQLNWIIDNKTLAFLSLLYTHAPACTHIQAKRAWAVVYIGYVGSREPQDRYINSSYASFILYNLPLRELMESKFREPMT